jgi:LmbE family N-acetylglucosaminyl deacetylase
VFAWLRSHESFAAVSDPADPRAVVRWYYTMIYVKIRRALRGLADDSFAGRDWPADHDGSAKVALLAVERSQAAWLQIIEQGMAAWKEAEPFIRQLLWLRDEIERVFPNPRVRQTRVRRTRRSSETVWKRSLEAESRSGTVD